MLTISEVTQIGQDIIIPQSSVVEGAVEVEEDGPEDGCGEEDGGDFAAGGEGELRRGVGAVAFAETAIERTAGATVAGASEVEALRSRLWRVGR